MGKLLLLLVPDLNNTWHFSVICLWCYSIWSLTKRTEGMPRRARSSKGPRHKSDPHRNVVLTLTVQSKGQCDVTGIWAGERQTEGQQRRGTHTKLPKHLAGYVHGAAGPRFFWLIFQVLSWIERGSLEICELQTCVYFQRGRECVVCSQQQTQQAQMRGVPTWIPAGVFYLGALRG